MKKTALKFAGAALAVPTLLGGLALPAHATDVSISPPPGPVSQPLALPEALNGYSPAVRAKTANTFAAVRTKNAWLGTATGNITYDLGIAIKKYKGGSIVGVPGGYAFALKPAIRDAYLRYGPPTSQPLGYPMSAEISLPGGGSVQRFSNGDIHWTSKGGAHHVVAWGLWEKHGGMTGRLGYPTSDWIKDGTKGFYQTFKGGKIVYTASKGFGPDATKVVYNK